jgi:uncharacterized membrane protein YecN with MAPEG domain
VGLETAKQDRIKVVFGILTAWTLSLAFVFLGLAFRSPAANNWTPWQASAFAMTIAAIALVAGIGWAARTRHFVSNIDGSAPAAGTELDLILRYVTNTTEQLVLFCVANFAAAALAPDLAQRFLPILGVWFLLARIIFYIGYRFHPLARSVGFAATFHPTIALMCATLFVFFY